MEKRLFGPILSSAEGKTTYAGNDEFERMRDIRHKIEYVRARWPDASQYQSLTDIVRSQLRPETQPRSVRSAIRRMLDGFKDYADTDFGRPQSNQREDYSSLELYCTEDGYNLFYSTIARTLRLHDTPNDLLVAAVTLVEFLTIDLYNLRLANIGDETYSNFQGVVYRGMRITPDQARVYEELAQRPDITQRNFSIPLILTSASADASIMEEFATEERLEGEESLHLTIHVHGIDADLLRPYLAKYPDSVVTSICAMPIARISPFGEKEILLRGAFFQIIRLRTVAGPHNTKIHELEAVMMNSNRDHVTETSSNAAGKQTQREAFRAIVNASKYEVCARLAEAQAATDANQYRQEQLRLLSELRQRYHLDVRDNVDLASKRSHGTATWLGARKAEDLPLPYAKQRATWQRAMQARDWTAALETLKKDYDWDQNHWFNVPWLEQAVFDSKDSSSQSHDSSRAHHEGYTALHTLAEAQVSKQDTEAGGYAAWCELKDVASGANVWKTICTFDDTHTTPHDLAVAHRNPDLVSCLAPKIVHEVAPKTLLQLESQLHTLMQQHAGALVDDSIFRLPQISVLTEMKTPELWIPIPHWYGGFRISLVENAALHVIVFETVKGHPQPKRTEITLQI